MRDGEVDEGRGALSIKPPVRRACIYIHCIRGGSDGVELIGRPSSFNRTARTAVAKSGRGLRILTRRQSKQFLRWCVHLCGAGALVIQGEKGRNNPTSESRNILLGADLLTGVHGTRPGSNVSALAWMWQALGR
jgi:hypothetical protein